jgi:RNA polymerase sigma-70 factor, ECF subfamily
VSTALTTALNAPAGTVVEAVVPSSFDEIMRLHQKRVYRVAYVLLQDRDAADTVTQECFLRAYQNLPKFRGECRLETWLIRIAVNLVRDHQKSRRASFWRRLVGLDHAESDEKHVVSPQPSQEQAWFAQQQLQAVWASVDILSPQQREIFLFRFVEEMQLNEIAELLGVKTGTVKAQLFRALSSVRKHMKEQQWR